VTSRSAVFAHREFFGHERVVFASDRAAGLRAIVAIHDRTLGPAIGGCRLFPYVRDDDALADVLRLSRGMTYKNALGGLPFGGGKSVIIADPGAKTPEMLRAFAEVVNGFQGQYWTGEDVNIGTQDVETIACHSPYVIGRTGGAVGSGDPSPFTAGGCFAGMKAALRHVYGTENFVGRRVAIQGVGRVGFALARLVTEAGGALTVADVQAGHAARAQETFGAQVMPPDSIYDAACDVFAPCAMGGTISEATVRRLRARIVCGVANNQLAKPEVGRLLLERGIVYAPDYVVNVGGMLNASGDFFGRYDVDEVWRRVNAVGETTAKVLATAAQENRPPHDVADAMAEAILQAHSLRVSSPSP
jgi:leucine dehydrogenase